VRPLAATLLLQLVGAFIMRLPPTIGPELTAGIGLSSTAIGHLSALGTLGSIAFLLLGAPLIASQGSVRALQIGTLLSAAGVLALMVPSTTVALISMLMMGIGYGPSPPAGSEILNRYAPLQHRSLIFSVKQAGVPVGGMLAGLLLPPVVDAAGVAGAVVLAAVISVAAVLAVQPLRAAIDGDRRQAPRLSAGSFLAVENLRLPFETHRRVPAIRRTALAGLCFAVSQGCWFAFLVTFLVVRLDYSLALAGLVFAATQVTGIFGRVLLGWVADRVGSAALTLAVIGLLSGLTSLALAVADKSWPLWLMLALAGIAGVTVGSWNGVQLAEVARLSPPAEIPNTTATATAIIFVGYIAGPMLFALLVQATDRYDLALVLVAAVGVNGGGIELLDARAQRARPPRAAPPP
jgi:MFS family permease